MLLFNIYIKLLGENVCWYMVLYCQYVDDIQLYISTPSVAVVVLTKCLEAVRVWLQLNPGKMEWLWDFGPLCPAIFESGQVGTFLDGAGEQFGGPPGLTALA